MSFWLRQEPVIVYQTVFPFDRLLTCAQILRLRWAVFDAPEQEVQTWGDHHLAARE